MTGQVAAASAGALSRRRDLAPATCERKPNSFPRAGLRRPHSSSTSPAGLTPISAGRALFSSRNLPPCGQLSRRFRVYPALRGAGGGDGLFFNGSAVRAGLSNFSVNAREFGDQRDDGVSKWLPCIGSLHESEHGGVDVPKAGKVRPEAGKYDARRC